METINDRLTRAERGYLEASIVFDNAYGCGERHRMDPNLGPDAQEVKNIRYDILVDALDLLRKARRSDLVTLLDDLLLEVAQHPGLTGRLQQVRSALIAALPTGAAPR